jgi:hypothetical protein
LQAILKRSATDRFWPSCLIVEGRSTTYFVEKLDVWAMGFDRERSAERESVMEGAYFGLAMLLSAASGRQVRRFGFYRVQPLRHSS